MTTDGLRMLGNSVDVFFLFVVCLGGLMTDRIKYEARSEDAPRP